MEDNSCKECRFWDRISSSAKGYCRRLTPVALVREGKVESVWPESAEADWCGSFVRSERDKALGF